MPSAANLYDDEHRIFVQGMLCQGILNSKEVNALHEKALIVCKIDVPEKKVDRQKLLASNIQTINNELEPVGLVIKKGVDEDTGENYFMLINLSNRIIGGSKELGANIQVQWKSQELEYLRLLATEVLRSESKSITGREALHLTDQVGLNGGKRLTMEEAEETINRLMSAKWIKSVDDGSEITLGVRFLGEMESWMVEVIGGVAKCQICRRVVVRGEYCGCDEGIAWHKYCLNKQAKAGVAIKCKKCGDEVFNPTNSTNGGEPERGSQDLEIESSQPNRSRKRSGDQIIRGKIRRRTEDSDSD